MATTPGTKMQKVTLEGVRIIFRNFAGSEGQFNRKGDRNFAAVLTPEVAEAMERDGWNVKHGKPREDGEIPNPYLPVKVKFPEFGKPPRVIMVTSRGRTTLGEDELQLLDWADIKNVDLIVRPFQWEMNGNTGISAYLDSLYATINEDELELKYADVPDTAQNVMSERDSANPFGASGEEPF